MLIQATLLVALFLSPAIALDVKVKLCNDGCGSCGEEFTLTENGGGCLDNPDGYTHAHMQTTEDIAGMARWCALWSTCVCSPVSCMQLYQTCITY